MKKTKESAKYKQNNFNIIKEKPNLKKEVIFEKNPIKFNICNELQFKFDESFLNF